MNASVLSMWYSAAIYWWDMGNRLQRHKVQSTLCCNVYINTMAAVVLYIDNSAHRKPYQNEINIAQSNKNEK